MHSKALAFGGVVALAAAVGCGGGSSSSTFSTSVPSTSPVDTLSPTQTTQLCDDVDNYLTKQVTSQSACQLAAVEATAEEAAQNTALTDQQLQAECTAFIPLACALLTTDAGAASPDGGATTCGTAGCTATVSQVSACVNAVGPAFSQWEAMFPSCSSVTRAKLAAVSLDAGPMEPATCSALDSICPSFDPMVNLGLGSY
ncbi:MAG TPA: hypothetical protein VH853_01795 [Polyangia bacterium]|nr:hypothetical protein [Polyangia bacterium]